MQTLSGIKVCKIWHELRQMQFHQCRSEVCKAFIFRYVSKPFKMPAWLKSPPTLLNTRGYVVPLFLSTLLRKKRGPKGRATLNQWGCEQSEHLSSKVHIRGWKSKVRRAELCLSNEDASETSIWDPSSKVHWKSESRRAELRLSKLACLSLQILGWLPCKWRHWLSLTFVGNSFL